MQTLLTLKVDSRMKTALKKLAEKQFISSSAVGKQAIERHLQAHSIDTGAKRGKRNLPNDTLDDSEYVESYRGTKTTART